MLQRTRDGWTVYCDGSGCAEELEVHSPEHEFRDVLAALQEAGWVTRKNIGEYVHLCPACQEEEENKRA